MFFRRKIHTVCNNPHVHPFPVAMRYIGQRWWNGLPVHAMWCPVCQRQRYFAYDTMGRYRRVA
jgi:hypothetical protein